jgi:hypothetical protein
MFNINVKKKFAKEKPEEIGTAKVAGYIDYFSGLWVKGWVCCEDMPNHQCEVVINGESVFNFTADGVRADLLDIEGLKNGKGFDVQIPPSILVGKLQSPELVVTLKVNGVEIEHSLVVPVNHVYRSVVDTLYDDINYYLAMLPILRVVPSGLLSDEQTAFFIKTLIISKLENDPIFSKLVLNLKLDSLSQELVSELLSSDAVLLMLLNRDFQSSDQETTSPILEQKLKLQPYLKTKELLEASSLAPQEIHNLLQKTGGAELDRFNFIESFPMDVESAISQWNGCAEADKRELWPLLMGAIQFKSNFEIIKYLSFNPNWYLDHAEESDDYFNSINRILDNTDYDWFSLSIALHASLVLSDSEKKLQILEKVCWKIWTINFFDYDVFAHIVSDFAKRGLSSSEREKLFTIVNSVVDYIKYNDQVSLYRKQLIGALVSLINMGLTKTCNAALDLELTLRPYLSLDEEYLSAIDITPVKRYDYPAYKKLKSFYQHAERVSAFYLMFDESSHLDDTDIIEIVERVMSLYRTHDVIQCKAIFLDISRYCQLHNRKALYPILKALHMQLVDYYGALNLERDSDERTDIAGLISEEGDKTKRTDSYWFKKLLLSRREGVEPTVEFIHELIGFIGNVNQSETLHMGQLEDLIQGELVRLALSEKINSRQFEELLALAESSSNRELTIARVASELAYKGIFTTATQVYDRLATVMGGHDRVKWLFDNLGLDDHKALSLVKDKTLATRIKQQFVFPYTQVMVYSCQAYKDTRHKIVKDTWIKDLEAFDIGWSIVVGGDRPSAYRDGYMQLKVEDTYEALPLKSLEMFSFASSNSSYRYFYKIDDDCVLNAIAMFGDPSYLDHSYYGRVVTRPLGGVDRSWHHKKSTSTLAKTSLDLSPENSSYCDGSTGYILDVKAAKAVASAYKDPFFAPLIYSSYFEDKLIGDILAIKKFDAVEKGYNCVIRRKTESGIDAQVWDYGLNPNRDTAIKVLHTEDDDYRRYAYENLLHSKAVTHSPLLYRDATASMSPAWLSAEEQEPVLEVVDANLEAIKKAKILAIIVTKNESEFLPKLLAHHRAIGVDHFLFVDNASSDESIEYMKQQDDVSVFLATQDYKFSRFGVNWQQTLCSHYGLGKWVLIIDSDELYAYDGFENNSLHDLTAKADEEGANAILAPMIDFYPSAPLKDADITADDRPFYSVCSNFDSLETMAFEQDERYGPYSNSKIYSGGLRERVFGRYNPYPQPNYLNQKYNLVKYNSKMKFIEGLHFMYGAKVFSKQCGIMHFKYHSGFHAKVEREVVSSQHWNGATEYKRYLKKLKNNKCFNLKCKESISYRDSWDLVKSGYVSVIFSGKEGN